MEQFFAPALAVLLLSGVFVMLGIGGSSIFIPILTSLGISIKEAIMAGLFINIVSTGLATSIFMHKGLFKFEDLKHSSLILLGMVIAIPVGVWVSNLLSPNQLTGLFSAALFILAIVMLRGSPKPKEHLSGKPGAKGSMQSHAILASIGGLAGLANGILGIGGGVFKVPSLIMHGMPARRAARISIACTFIGSVYSFANHLVYTSPNFSLLAFVGGAAFIGSFAGSSLTAAGKVPENAIKNFFPLLLVAFAIKLASDFLAQ